MEPKEYNEIYTFMTSGDEACEILNPNDCNNFVSSKWKREIGFRVFIEGGEGEDIMSVVEGISIFRKFAGDVTEGRISFSNNVENVFFYIGGDEYRRTLREGGGTFPRDTFLKMENALTSQDCFAIIQSVGDEIIRSSIFIPQGIMAVDIKLCVLEELYNSTGVLRDPPGASSLFSYGLAPSSYEHYPYSPLLASVLRDFYSKE
ncbi:hypothetical protein [Phaeobacter inhibens]|uniref:hypothetical protein n=1 Tax=Phaeobacter inhibens TaxID=221822 RepID=UPI0012EC8661|nr:hypothetical protein [Phaeobacter inhibens]